MENASYHIHCNECYRRRCNDPVGCVMTTCGRGCDSILHSCKLEDHNFVCPKVKIACINALYGCPFVIERSQMSQHLVKCPAALLCTQGWSRFPSRRTDTVEYPTYNKDTLEWSFAMRDQMQLQSRDHDVFLTKRFMSLAPTFDADVRWDELVMGVDGEEDDEGGDEEVNVDEVVAPPEQFSVNEANCEEDDDEAARNDGVTVQRECIDTGHMKVELSITRLPVYVHTRQPFYQFSCRQCFRRDEIHGHYDNVHNNIISHLGVWMDIHCPLRLYGCSFTRANLIPRALQGSRIVFNKQFNSFALQTMPSVCTSSNVDLLSSLPVEIVLVIFDYLDSFSLMSVAFTCRRLRDVSCKILMHRGVVDVVWQKDGSTGKWQDHECWYFSTSFSQTQWMLSHEELICQHLLTCKYHKQHVSEKSTEERLQLPGLNRSSFDELSATLQTQTRV